jgi:uroporphyrinogen-III synthase
MITIFISRNLAKDSPFLSLNSSFFSIYDNSLIDFAPIQVDHLPDAEWYFFYSKNGVKYFHESLGMIFMKSSEKRIKVACMGYGTKDEFQKYFDYNVSFTGSGNPTNVAREFSKNVKNEERVVFFTAEDSLHSVGNKLPPNIGQKQIIIYRNRQKEKITIPKSNILIFTSPKNAEAYFDYYDSVPNQKIISIGKSTAKKLHDLGVEEVIIATYPSEEGLLKSLKTILRHSS